MLWLLFRAAAIVVAGVLVGSWLEGVVRTSLDGRVDPIVRELLSRLVRPVVVGLAVLVALAAVGLKTGPFVAVLAAATLALGLSLRETLANAAAGALLLSRRPYRAGDRVTLAGVDGEVVEQTLFTTTLKADDAVITLGNALVLGAPIVVRTGGAR